MLCSLCQFDNPASAERCRACGAALSEATSENSATSDALPTGALLIGTYVVESVLGQGGFGITYRCHDQMLDRRVAVKEFFPSGCRRQGRDVGASRTQSESDYREARAQFLAEARLLARCHHAGIVSVHTAFEANQTAYMVMELLHGQSLAQLLTARGGSLDEADAVGFIERVGAALSFVHGLDLLHRDIKPDNIMVCDDGRVMLIDFGTARETLAGQAQNHTVVVTPGYAPLEQYARQARRGAFTDIYSLAATLYHLLTGQMPPAASDRAMGVMLRPMREINPNVSASVARAIEAGLQMEIDKRPQSVDEFLELLKTPVGSNEISPVMESAIERADLVAEDDDELDSLIPFPIFPALANNPTDALRARQLLEGFLPGEASLNEPPLLVSQPVKIAPQNPIPAHAKPSAAPTSSSLFASGAVGNVGVKNTSSSKGATSVLWWFFSFVLVVGFIGAVTLSNTKRNPTTNTPPNFQSFPPNSFPSSSQNFSSPETAQKRSAAAAAWNTLPVLTPTSVVALPYGTRQGSTDSAGDALIGSRVEFSPDGKRLAYADNQNIVRVLSLPNREVIHTLKLDPKSPVHDVMFSPDNQTLAVSLFENQSQGGENLNVNQVSVWNLRTGKSLGAFATEQKASNVLPQTLFNDGRMLLTTTRRTPNGSSVSEQFVWNAKTDNRGNNSFTDAVALHYGVMSPDGKEFVVGDDEGRLRWLDVKTGKQKAEYTNAMTTADYKQRFGNPNSDFDEQTTTPLSVLGIDYSLNGQWLASRNNAEITVFDAKAKKVGTLTIDAKSSRFFSMSPDGEWLAAEGSLPYGPNGKLLWNVKTKSKIRLQAPFDNLMDWGFSSDGKQLYGVFAGENGFQFVTWQTDATPVAAFTRSKTTPLALQLSSSSEVSSLENVALSNKNLFLAVPTSKTIEIYLQGGAYTGGALWKKFDIGNFKPGVRQFAKIMEFSPDNSLFAYVMPYSNGGTIEIWDLNNEPRRITTFAQEEAITALAFSADKKSLVSGGVDGLVRQYDLTKRVLKAEVKTNKPVVALTATESELKVLSNTVNATYRLPLDAETKPQQSASIRMPDLSDKIFADKWTVSADGKLLASAQRNRPIAVWKLNTGSLLQKLPDVTDNGLVYGLKFSDDGTQLTVLEGDVGFKDLSLTIWNR